MTRNKKIFGGIAGFLLLVIVVLAIILATFDWNRLKPTINAKVSDAIGRPFAINGDLSVHWQREPGESGWHKWVPWPHVSAQDIAIGNTDWGKAPQFATLSKAQFSLAPLPLIAHRVQIRDIQLTQPLASLERLKDGRANWDFSIKDSGPQAGQPSSWTVDIDQIGFDQGRVDFTDATLKADLQVLIDPLGKPIPFAEIAGAPASTAPPAAAKPEAERANTAVDTGSATAGSGSPGTDTGSPGAPGSYVFGWNVKGKYNAQALAGSGKIGGMLTLRDGKIPFPVQADVKVGDTRARVVGTLTDPLKLGALDLRLRLAGKSMADLYPLTGVTLPDTPPYETDGRLTAQLQRPEGSRFEYSDFNGRVGKSDLHGGITFTAGKPRPKLTGKLRSNQLRVEDLGPLVGVQSGGAKKPDDQAKKQPANKALPVQEFRTDRWNVMDADVQLSAGKIIYSEKLPLSDLAVHVVMDQGKLALDPLDFGMAGGKLQSAIALNGSKTPMLGRVKLRARGFRLKQLFATAASMQKSLGQLNGDAVLTGKGNSVAALLGSSNGEVKLLVNDGVISRNLMEIAGLNVGNYVVGKLFGDKEVNINCGAADAGIKDGLLTTRIVIFDTENALIKVSGTANFDSEALDLNIDPESKGFRIVSLRSPLYVKGTFKDPKPGVQILPLAARGAGMVVLGAALTPVAGLLALIAPSSGNDDKNQCSTLLNQMRKEPRAPPASAARAKKK